VIRLQGGSVRRELIASPARRAQRLPDPPIRLVGAGLVPLHVANTLTIVFIAKGVEAGAAPWTVNRVTIVLLIGA